MSNLIVDQLNCKIREEQHNYMGAMDDLSSLVDVVIRYINGESSIERLESYLRANYPNKSIDLK